MDASWNLMVRGSHFQDRLGWLSKSAVGDGMMTYIKDAELRGLDNNMAWTGGSLANPRIGPATILCYCPTEYKDMRKQHSDLQALLKERFPTLMWEPSLNQL